MNAFTKSRTHIQAEEKYNNFREATYEATAEVFPEIEVRGITYSDTILADRWKNSSDKNDRYHRSSWDWKKEFLCYQKRPNRFEISLWRGNTLGALCYGQTSKQGTRVRMNLIESVPHKPSPLGARALPIISYAAAVFANIVGADELWVLDPDIRLEEQYKNQGFSSRTIYHGRRVGQRRIL